MFMDFLIWKFKIYVFIFINKYLVVIVRFVGVYFNGSGKM